MKKIRYGGVRGYFMSQDEYDEVRKVLNHQSTLLKGVTTDDNSDNRRHKP